jgi:ribosomal protein S18 acetylase RimI-like enzyme
MKIRRAEEADAGSVSKLIHSLSQPFVASPDGSGAEQFFASVSEAATRRYILAANYDYFVAEVESVLAGIVVLRDRSHLFHLFVAPEFQGQGFGRNLWNHVLELARREYGVSAFTVNSSLNAKLVYERFGFTASSEPVYKHGIAYIPMRLDVSHHGV